MARFSAKQKAFIEHYLQCWNASKAARLAGYSERSAGSIGHENLKKPEIMKEIDARLAAMTMSANEVLMRLTQQGRSDLGEFIGLSESELKDHPQSYLIKKYKHFKTTDKDGETTERIELELYDGQTALLNIGKYHRLFTDRVDVTSDGQPVMQPAVEAMKDLFQAMGQREKANRQADDAEEGE